MNLTVSYYGLLAERRGVPEEMVKTSAATVEDLYRELDGLHGLGLVITDFRAAVNDEFVEWSKAVEDGDRIALLPPMSGG